METVLYETVGNSVPERHVSGYFNGHDGKRLRYAIFKSDAPVAKGTVVLLHGRNECIEKYFETIKDLNAAGLWVATFDWRGQGASDRLLGNSRLGHIGRFGDYEKDLNIFFEEHVLPDARLPFFVLAHSMGGLVALSASPNLANRVERMVVCAPFLGLETSRLSETLIYRVSAACCHLGFGDRAPTKDRAHHDFEDNVLTSDPVRFKRNAEIAKAHPELELGPPTFRWLYENLKMIRRVSTPSFLTKITIPTLVLAPTRDRVASFPMMEDVSRRFRAGEMIAIDGAAHELLQERDLYRSQAMAAITAFLPGSEDNATF